MSLNVDHGGSCDRSRSRDRRDSDRDRSRVRVQDPPPIRMESVEMPSPPAGFSYDYDAYGTNTDPRVSTYNLTDSHRDSPSYRVVSPTQESSHYRHDGYDGSPRGYAGRGEKEESSSPMDQIKRGAEALLPAKYATKLRDVSREREYKKEVKKEKLENDLAYGNIPSLEKPKPSRKETSPSRLYIKPQPYGYDRSDVKSTLSSSSLSLRHEGDPRSPLPNVVTADLDSRSRTNQAPLQSKRVAALSINTSHHRASSSLTVNTGHASPSQSLANAPPSPLLEAYHGTYQSMSPMPSPLLMPSSGPAGSAADLEPLSPGISDSEAAEKKRRRARFHDPVDDAARLAQALRGDRKLPDTEPLIELLPGMTHEQLMELRVEYKQLVKAGPERKGVNVAKHIRARLKDEDPSLMKACYATALGRWESEAYWANFWYQGDKTRRELLIEALMGRPNDEVRAIEDAFSDKKYRDSLVACMRAELREDKFKRAVLLALEARRMEDRDDDGRPLPVDQNLVRDDVEALYRAVRADRGGETAMLQIIVLRSDAHLREILRFYEKSFHSNFARDALKKSGNLVGEVLAHILNGVINKPVRDALLLHHALKESRGSGKDKDKDGLRRDLLTSRLVRYHWDRHHMAAVKRAYRERYGQELADAVRDGTTGAWGLFCQQLVVTRMPDDVKKFARDEGIVREVRKEDRDAEKERERERERERQWEYEREREKERDREREKDRAGRHRAYSGSSGSHHHKEDRDHGRESGRERRHTTSGNHLEVKGHSGRDRSRSRERSRDRSRDRSRSRRDN